MEKLIISFSGGQTSAYMTTLLLEKEAAGGDTVETIIFCNTGMEHEGTLLFVQNCSELWGREVVWLEWQKDGYDIVNFATASRKGEPFERLIIHKSYLPCTEFRFCTEELKVLLIEKYLKVRGLFDLRQALGIRADEPSRYYKISHQENKVMPLFKMGITKQMVLDFWDKQPFKLNIPAGFGNCTLCFLKGKLRRIAILRADPTAGEWWAKMEALVTAMKSKRIMKKLSKQLKATPELSEWLLAAKTKPKKNTFDKQYSVKQLMHLAQSQFTITSEMLKEDIDISCACNID